ncbi:hypothetical protein [Paraburkholderia diazotrophica]|uniref:Phasin protein n=1 Tax=Paraburkholderia diazotrophica TaxID=667676 RepID=A0A1H7EA74_9BURK|nr:hypothetical protein [Paraburkholderia diazotrophica]SEK10816.1 hypothetical protein SAMN05192539_104919 [Paraburkholderia diazotrophica]
MDTAPADLHATTSTPQLANMPAYGLPCPPYGAATLHALALAHSEALTKWMALWTEMCTRMATAQNVLDCAAIGPVMLPAYASRTMLYYKRLSEIASGVSV